MWLLLIEALAALGLLVFAVWWTMFSGRRRGERDGEEGERAERSERAERDERGDREQHAAGRHEEPPR